MMTMILILNWRGRVWLIDLWVNKVRSKKDKVSENINEKPSDSKDNSLLCETHCKLDQIKMKWKGIEIKLKLNGNETKWNWKNKDESESDDYISMIKVNKYSKRRWCSGNMKPFQGLASGSIPERRNSFFILFLIIFWYFSFPSK